MRCFWDGRLDTAAGRLRQATPSLTDEFALELARRVTKTTEAGVVWSWDPKLQCRSGLTTASAGLAAIDFASLLRTFAMPVTVVFGSRSNLGRQHNRRLLENAADACFTLPGGHGLTVDAPDELVGIIFENASAASVAAAPEVCE